MTSTTKIRFEPINQSAHSGWAAASVFGVAALHPSLTLEALIAVWTVALLLETKDIVARIQTPIESLIDVAFYVLGSGAAFLAVKLIH